MMTIYGQPYIPEPFVVVVNMSDVFEANGSVGEEVFVFCEVDEPQLIADIQSPSPAKGSTTPNPHNGLQVSQAEKCIINLY